VQPLGTSLKSPWAQLTPSIVVAIAFGVRGGHALQYAMVRHIASVMLKGGNREGRINVLM